MRFILFTGNVLHVSGKFRGDISSTKLHITYYYIQLHTLHILFTYIIFVFIDFQNFVNRSVDTEVAIDRSLYFRLNGLLKIKTATRQPINHQPTSNRNVILFPQKI